MSGSNPSAAMDSITAASGGGCLMPRPAREGQQSEKSQGVRGKESAETVVATTFVTEGKSRLAFQPNRRFTPKQQESPNQ